MADDASRRSSGLAIVLNSNERSQCSGKSHLISSSGSLNELSVERVIEHIFNLPFKRISTLNFPVDSLYIRSIIKNEFTRHHLDIKTSVNGGRDGISAIYDKSSESGFVTLEDTSMCGDIRIVKKPLLVESGTLFSSARANVCVWKGKWMYEVTLETSGIQQIGWATIACAFTNHEGVGDSDDSYAYDGNRVRKWNKEAEPYGQPWVVGDVIGCCIDLDSDEISFYRNGVPLGVAFGGIQKLVPGFGYYPAISLSQGERCELNFGAVPFQHPIDGYFPIQSPPSVSFVDGLFDCFRRLLQMLRPANAEIDTVEELIKLKRFASFEKLLSPVSHAICEELFSVLESSAEYVGYGSFCSFIMEIFRLQPPHDYLTVNRIIDSFLGFKESEILFEHLIGALSARCKTASLILTDCPYSGSYSYLALACHMFRRKELMMLWWKSSDFDLFFEGFLSRKIPSKQDLQCLIPSVWWPGSCEDASNEHSMMLTTTALSEAIKNIEDKHRELCRLVMQFVPPVLPPQFPGSVFRTFLRNILLKNRGADRSLPPPGISSNPVLVSLFTVILHFLSEGFDVGGINSWIKESGSLVGLLHRGGERSFPASLFLKSDPHRVDLSRLGGSYSHLSKLNPAGEEEEIIRWEEASMDDEETRVTHLSRQKPCCCYSYDSDLSKISSKDNERYFSKRYNGSCSNIPETSSHVPAECSSSSISDEIVDKPSTSGQPDSEYTFRTAQQHFRIFPRDNVLTSATTLNEEELLDAMLLLYHLGIAPNFKQASAFMLRQASSISSLEDTDRQINESVHGEIVKRLKEARGEYREELMNCVRHSAWFRVSLLSRWKQRGMYATCIWIVQLLLVVSKRDSMFVYVPEYYLETLVDMFHVLRKSDPPFFPASLFIKQGLASFVTFIATHFDDPRISSAELKDLLLHSISVLVQYKEFLAVFECNEAAKSHMPKALLSAFNNRSWITVTDILLRLCKGSSLYSANHRGESSSSSAVFQKLLREACTNDVELFSTFLNCLFNTLSWSMTEFSVSISEMQDNCKLMESQKRKCGIIFDLSYNLVRVLEFCTRHVPQAFVSGSDVNLRRLAELIVFILNNLIRSFDPEFLDITLRRPGLSPEKVNTGMILSPLAVIILNLMDAYQERNNDNDIVAVFDSMECADTILIGFRSLLLDQNWGDEESTTKLENFWSILMCRQSESEAARKQQVETEDDQACCCCICYANRATARFLPCSHVSCHGCISRHLLNCHRCFFCNCIVCDVVLQGVGVEEELKKSDD